MRTCFSLLLLIGSLTVGVGQPVLQLSEKHLEKVMGQDNPFKKRKTYLKFYHKDSLRYVKEVDRYWKAKFDSSSAFVSNKRNSLKRKVEQVTNKAKDPLKRLEAAVQIHDEMFRFSPALEANYSKDELRFIYSTARYYLVEVSKDTAGVLTQMFRTDLIPIPELNQLNKSGIRIPKLGDKVTGLNQNLKGEINERLGKNNYLNKAQELKGDATKHLVEFKQYEQYANMTPDSLMQAGMGKLEQEAESKLLNYAGASGLQKQMSEFNQLQNQYKGQLNSLQDSAARIEMAKKKAEELAMQYIADNPGVMKDVQEKVNLLMKKYSSVINSNDLSTAVKRTSLEGRTFKERLVIAANFQLLTIDPVAIDFSPQIGYRFNSQFTLGFGGTYRQTFNDSIPALSPDVFGYKGFLSYEVAKSFFAYGEYAQNSPGVQMQEGISKRLWTPAAFLGVGRKFAVHKKVDMTVVAMYNFLHKTGDPIYPRPFVVRFGFQLSEIAFLKKKPDRKIF